MDIWPHFNIWIFGLTSQQPRRFHRLQPLSAKCGNCLSQVILSQSGRRNPDGRDFLWARALHAETHPDGEVVARPNPGPACRLGGSESTAATERTRLHMTV
jgi:hypothetical protein